MKKYGKLQFLLPTLLLAILSAVLLYLCNDGILPVRPVLYIYSVSVILIVFGLSIYWSYFRTERIEHQKARLKTFIESFDTAAIIWESDMSGTVSNSALKKLLGYSDSDITEAIILKKLFPEKLLTPSGISRLISNQGKEFYADSKDGKRFIILWNTSVFYEDRKTNKKLLVSIGTDITDYKRVRSELAESERRYQLSMELSEIGILLSDDSKSCFYVSDQLAEMLGFDNNEVTFDQFREKVFPNDLVLYDTYLRYISSENIALTKDIHTLDIRLLSANNEYRWYQHRFKVVINPDNSTTIGGAFLDITKEKEKDVIIERMAYIDEITELCNRNRLMLIGQETFDGCLELGYSYWLIVFDIDKFHFINDTYGYANGNYVLNRFGKIVAKHISVGGIASRISSDNFVLLLKDNGNSDLPVITITAIQREFSELAIDVFASQTFSCSAGFSRMPQDGANFAEVLDRAEFALSSGEKARGSIVNYNQAEHEMIIVSNQLEKALADAINNNELALYYQPKIDLSNGRMIGVEALVRWKRKDGSLVMPGQFVPVAEASQLISKISEYALFEACRQNMEWQKAGLPKIIVSINLTSVDFYESNVLGMIDEILDATGMSSEWLEIELTESLALKDVDKAVSHMDALRERGIRIAMDDFGTGYSSLSYIQILPITLLKLDRSFIINLETDEVAREIVSAVIRIAKAKKIDTIAEGIETIGQTEILLKSGCDFGQGYFFAKPLPAPELAKYLARTNWQD